MKKSAKGTNPPREPWGRNYRTYSRQQIREVAKEVWQTGPPGPGERFKARTDYLIGYVALLLGLIAFGYDLRNEHAIWALILYMAAALQSLCGLWYWFGLRWRRSARISLSILVVGAFVIAVYTPLVNAFTPTYLLVIPAGPLFDAERRVFFIEHVGPKRLNGVEITVQNTDTGEVLHTEKHDRMDDSRDSADQVPPYFWLTPSTPWAERYTITVASAEERVVQHLVVRSTKKTLQLGVRVTVAGNAKPVISCRDPLLQDADFAKQSPTACTDVVKIPHEWVGHLRPPWYTTQLPDGTLEIDRVRELSPPLELENKSENRHLWEYQADIIKKALLKFRDTRLMILETTGPATSKYASELTKLFLASQWKIIETRAVPSHAERIIDLQISSATDMPAAKGLLDAFSAAGVKGRSGIVTDPDAPRDTIVLWIGPRSPDNVKTDDCALYMLKPIGPHQPCDLVATEPQSIPVIPE